MMVEVITSELNETHERLEAQVPPELLRRVVTAVSDDWLKSVADPPEPQRLCSAREFAGVSPTMSIDYKYI